MSRSTLRQAYGPDTMGLLMTIYDECLQELLTWYSASEPADLHGMDQVVAERIMGAAAGGVVDPREIRRRALGGLLPKRAVGGRQ
jgi:hypothetical protein